MFCEKKPTFPEINEVRNLLSIIFTKTNVVIKNNTIIIESDAYNEPAITLFALREKQAIDFRVQGIGSELDRFIIHHADLNILKACANHGIVTNKPHKRSFNHFS